MLFKGLLATALSGKVDGIVASHNRGGTYFRNLAIPTNPNTPEQAAVRAIFRQLAALWRDTLTPAQRAAWDEYALQTPLTNRVGDPINVGGLGMYQRGNVARLQAGKTRVDEGPTTFGLPTLTSPTIASITASSGVLSLNFTVGDAWVDIDDTHLIVYGSRGQNASINFFKGPYRLAGTVDGDATTAPTSPEAITLPFTVAVGQKVFVKASLALDDGRYSSPFRIDALAT